LRQQAERQPEFWDDPRYNNPAQPVVGVSWFEARAYCCWLTATAATGQSYRLSTEAEYEAATRGQAGRMYAYGDDFDASRCNTYLGGVGRPTPVGLYDNATPEGAFDLTGNVFTWTSSIYRNYPYRYNDGRENLDEREGDRVLRGGAWNYIRLFARAVYRDDFHPGYRGYNVGFRVVVVSPPS
jgi:formylglycine-generating enzyme required for sulfatase activity